MKRFLFCILLLAFPVFAQQISPGVMRSIPYSGTPERTFRVITGDTTLQLPSALLDDDDLMMLVSVENNPARLAFQGLASWERMVSDTLKNVDIINDSTLWGTNIRIKLISAGTSILTGMLVQFTDSLSTYQNPSGYNVTWAQDSIIIVELADGDTFVADSIVATTMIQTVDYGHIWPEGTAWEFTSKEQVDNSYWCSADSGLSATLQISIYRK